jgi:hypothetical protein
MGLFTAFTIITLARYFLYPRLFLVMLGHEITLTLARCFLSRRFFLVMLGHETHSLFLGTIPMGFVTIVSGIARTGTEYGIEKALDAGLVMWWIALGASGLRAETHMS